MDLCLKRKKNRYNRFCFYIQLTYFHSFSHLVDNSLDVQSMYSSELTLSGPTYSRTGCFEGRYFYEAIEVKVVKTGNYSLGTNSTMDTYGYIYKNDFNSFHPFMNLLLEDDQSYRNDQFKLVTRLQINITYILVVTTYFPSVTGVFSVLVIGPNNVILNRISEYPYYSFNTYDRITKYTICLYT